ncbi:hypothetical protein [Mosqueiro virus]|uniref:Uncharacterized protein n=1 Tax=Mosqueiro virus TaxID=200403 RepID=A0A0D3R240_9RHAB|nr:hypothetical protein [Mosqueiro virus]AJR28520.1 hypothetical protein [Mosqueiro virus]
MMNLHIIGRVEFSLPAALSLTPNIWKIQKQNVSEYRRLAGLTQDVAGLAMSFLYSKLRPRLIPGGLIAFVGDYNYSTRFPNRFANVRNLRSTLQDSHFIIQISGFNLDVKFSMSLFTQETMIGMDYHLVYGEDDYQTNMAHRTLDQDAKTFGFGYVMQVIPMPNFLN